MAENDTQPIAPARFEPLEAPHRQRRWRIPPSAVLLALAGLVALGVLTYLFAARAVIFRLDPPDAIIDVRGLAFNIGDNFLLLPGEHEVAASAEGYHPLEQTITVGGESTQEIELALEPLPGTLDIRSDLEDITVLVDDEPAGTAPGLIEGVSRGPHKLTFEKYRYFPRDLEFEVEGLGRTQSLEVTLEPAWGGMAFASEPEGADLYVDDRLVGQTPMVTEVLETGSVVRLQKTGYKTWQREVTIEAGTEAEYPPIVMTVADGDVRITSRPAGAGVTIGDEYRGATPLTVALSPLEAHRVELFLEGYRRAVRTVEVEPDGEAALAVDLTPVLGRIRLSVSPPDAEVLVDGRSQGTGDADLSLTATDHRLVVRRQGYETQEMTITPRPDREQSLDIDLMTLEEAYWASRPQRITSPAGTELKLFRPSAEFTMGAPRRQPGRRANEVERTVRLERPFYLGVREISNEEFRRWDAEHTSRAVRGRTLDMKDQPVANVSWQQAAKYCNWLSSLAGLPPFYLEENGLVTDIDVESPGFRLPTEAEWAWAARTTPQGETLVFPWGNDLYPPPRVTGNYADVNASDFLTFAMRGYDDGYAVAAPVGSFAPNARGLWDMGGNVAEWIGDYYEIAAQRGAPPVDPTGPANGDRRVIRGASWALGSRSELRLSYRDAGTDARMDVGFRIARYVDRPGAQP